MEQHGAKGGEAPWNGGTTQSSNRNATGSKTVDLQAIVQTGRMC